MITAAPKRYTIREENGLELLKLHAERAEIMPLIEAGTPLHTIFSLYPFDFEHYEEAVVHRIKRNGDFPLFSDNLHRAGGTLFREAVQPSNSAIHSKIAFGLLNADVDGRLTALTEALLERLYAQYLIGGTPVSAEKLAYVRSSIFTEFIYNSLAFAAYGAGQSDFEMAPALKQMMSHVLIYLCAPEIYGRWGFKNRAR